jgi:hypothetical protein
MTYSSDDPTLVSYPLARSAYEYIMRMKDLGAIEGALGEMSLLPALQPIVEAIHIVLAGGSVDVKVTARANPDIVRELEEMLKKGSEDANYINKKSGYYVTVGVP